MKIKSVPSPDNSFKPIDLIITIESREELHEIDRICRMNVEIPSWIYTRTLIPHVRVYNFLGKIRETIEGYFKNG
jgi:hypothetical protein